MALADVDADGDLDLYVANYRTTTVKDESLNLRMKRIDGLWRLPPEYEDRFISTPNLSGRGILPIARSSGHSSDICGAV